MHYFGHYLPHSYFCDCVLKGIKPNYLYEADQYNDTSRRSECNVSDKISMPGTQMS
jgi:hypothetical protein